MQSITPANPPRRVSRWLAPESLATSVGLGLIVTILMRAVGLGRSVVFARLLAPVELGAWSLAFNGMTLAAMLLGWGLPSALARYAERYRGEGRLRAFVLGCTAISLGAPLAVCAAGFYWRSQLAQWLFEDATRDRLLGWMQISLLVTALMNLVQGTFQGLRVSRLSLLMQLAQTILFAGFGGAILWYQPDATGALVAFVLASFIVLVTLSLPLRGEIAARRRTAAESRDATPIKAEPLGAAWGPIFSYSLAIWAAGGLSELWRLADRWLLVHASQLSPDDSLKLLASYHVVENITLPLLSIAVQASIMMLPHVTHLWEQREEAAARGLVEWATKVIALAFVCGAAVLLCLQTLLLERVFGDLSGESKKIFGLALAGVTIVAANYCSRSYLLCRERARTVVWTSAVGLALSIALNLWLIPRYELVGAAFAALASAWVSTALMLATGCVHGFRPNRATWGLVLVAPLTLLAPPPLALLVATCLVTVSATTNAVFSVEERTWMLARAARFLPGTRLTRWAEKWRLQQASGR